MSAPALQLLGLPPCVFQLSGPAAQAAHDNVKALVLSGPSDPTPPTKYLKGRKTGERTGREKRFVTMWGLGRDSWLRGPGLGQA
jgi:hypothetical protein